MFAITRTKQHWRIIELIEWGKHYLASRGIDSPRREIEWLLSDLLSLSRIDLYLNFEKTVKPEFLKKLRSWIRRRTSGEPIQYITGKTEFFGLPIRVNPHVLIPRSETERLVEIALELAQKIETEKIIDIGTGSGCVAIALARNLKKSRITAIDQNESILDIAKSNAELNQVEKQISFSRLNILSENITGSYDLLVSNPPYVAKNEVGNLMPEVKEFEPMNALTDGKDGLQFYRRFAVSGKTWIKEGGYMVLEIGLGSHPERVKACFENAGFRNITFYQDYNGDDRIATIEVNR